jgi:hypothetical protein
MDSTEVIDKIATESHRRWRFDRLDNGMRGFPEPEVYEDENGNFVNINDEDAYVPLSVQEAARENVQRELYVAQLESGRQSSLFKGKLDTEIARKLHFEANTHSDAERFDEQRQEKMSSEFDKLEPSVKKSYIEKAKMRRKQLTEYKVTDQPAPSRPRLL